MLNAVSTALTVAGAVTSTSTSWFAIISALIPMLLLWVYEERVTKWARSRISNVTVVNLLGRKSLRFLIQILVGFAAIWGAVIVSTVSILQPNVFIGYTDQPPLKFGRYIASVGRSASPEGGFCPEVQIVGDVVNTSDLEMYVWYSGDPIKVWTLNPSINFNGPVSISGISPANGGHTDIEPGSRINVTITAQMNQSLCRDYKANDLRRLRDGRINATTAIHIVSGKDKSGSLQPIKFQDLPIADRD